MLEFIGIIAIVCVVVYWLNDKSSQHEHRVHQNREFDRDFRENPDTVWKARPKKIVLPDGTSPGYSGTEYYNARGEVRDSLPPRECTYRLEDE